MYSQLSESDRLKYIELYTIVSSLGLVISEESLLSELSIADCKRHSQKIEKLKLLELKCVNSEAIESDLSVKEVEDSDNMTFTPKSTTWTAMVNVFDSKKEKFSIFLKKLVNAMKIDGVGDSDIQLMLLKAKLDTESAYRLDNYKESKGNITFVQASAFLTEVYDGDRARNMASIKAEKTSLDGIDEATKTRTIKTQLRNKLSFNVVLKTRFLDRFDFYSDFCELAMDISDYWYAINDKKGRGKKNLHENNLGNNGNRNFDINKIQCHKCKNYGYYANKCENKMNETVKLENKKDQYSNNKVVSNVESIELKESVSKVNKISMVINPNPLIILNMGVGKGFVDTLTDSGSSVSLMSLKSLKVLLKDEDIELKNTDTVLVGAFGNETVPVGKVNMRVSYDNMQHFIDIIIVSQLNYDMIPGINEIKLFNMLNIPSEYFSAEMETKILNKGEIVKSYLNNRVVNAASELEVSNEYILEEIKKNYPQVDKVLSRHSNDIGKFIHKVPKIEWDTSVEHSYFPYKYPVHQLEIGQYLLKEMLDADILEVGHARYLHNIIIVKKHVNENSDYQSMDNGKVDLNKQYRIVVDLRSLNKMCAKVEMPGMRIESLIPLSKEATRFISIDLCQSFHQFELDEVDRIFFDIAYPGMPCLRFKRLPQGFINSPVYMKYLLEKKIPSDLLQLYYDDGIRGTDTDLFAHIRIVEQIFRKLGDCDLKINASKSLLCATKLQVLGFEGSQYGAEPGARARNIMEKYKVPKSSDDIRRFLGFISYYRRFLPKLGISLQPITKLLRKNVVFIWCDECQLNFDKIKNLLLENPRLYTEVKNEPLMVNTDASFEGFGGCLYQMINKEFRERGEINSVAAKRNRGRPKKISNELNLDDENDEENNLTSNQKLFIQKLYEKGHFCYKKIFHLLDEKFGENKKKMARKELRKIIKECKSCLEINIGRSKKKSITMKVTGPRAVVNLDIAEPFMNQSDVAKGKKRYFISLVDYCSKTFMRDLLIF
ncbi:Reverse transcriptase domain and Zinc finger,CCHC-type domain-containing protein [Strongyloides ratti]|uniref:RNA-directed DNA polymerase n=1 Tax=Strongyloides ratti TaxID=34506 RepID=A0A090L1T9_STRRB|nr:Reverse transcriptase domain and Zinc finger,CCHC-type domain-containing protein [Strongyloides ratti]CEF61459.1 Reverse transcriptase domain and Zinc finger,CCHC-type domain-containing protein [Strongyloides ratti]